MEKKDFNAFISENPPIVLDKKYGKALLMRPVEVQVIKTGAKNDTPSMVIIMTHPLVGAVYGEISLEMFNEGMKDIGYQLTKIE